MITQNQNTLPLFDQTQKSQLYQEEVIITIQTIHKVLSS